MITIIDMIMNAMVERLTEVCQTNVNADDPTRAGAVKVGDLQDDPEKMVVSLLVHQNGTNWRHVRDPRRDEISNIRGWRRRFRVELLIYYTRKRYEHAVAQNYAHVVLARAEQALSDATDLVLRNEYGEQAWTDDFGETFGPPCNCLAASEMKEGGGEKEHLWKGKIYLEYETQRST